MTNATDALNKAWVKWAKAHEVNPDSKYTTTARLAFAGGVAHGMTRKRRARVSP